MFSLLTISFSQLNAQCALVCHNNITVGLDTAWASNDLCADVDAKLNGLFQQF
ncbi:MAG: hypothetical protein R2788_13870 [Saprospiraceae bacterium]